MLEKEQFVAYSNLAQRLCMPNDTGRGLGAISDEAALKWKAKGLPNITSAVVTKDSSLASKPMPPESSFNGAGKWPITGIHNDDIPAEQARVRNFDWTTLRDLNLKDSWKAEGCVLARTTSTLCLHTPP